MVPGHNPTIDTIFDSQLFQLDAAFKQFISQ